MKRVWLGLVMILLVGCSGIQLDSEIPEDKFNVQTQIPTFDIEAYIENIDPVITDVNYIRLDSVFLDDSSHNGIILTDPVIENLLQIYQVFEKNHDTYALINFLDLHIKKTSQVDIDILMYKIISRIEADYELHKGLVEEEQFNYLIVDYISRITDTFIDSYILDADVLATYPDMAEYLANLKRIVNGGYQIRRYDDQYYIFTDYASVLTRYKDYYSDETREVVDILVRESRNIYSINDQLQLDNEAIAYKVSEIESFIKYYSDSVYNDMLRDYYNMYMSAIVTNPRNLNEDLTYNDEAMQEMILIIDRYSDTQMSRILEEFVNFVEDNNRIYDNDYINRVLERIELSY